jgi:hypothetical protein
MITPLLLPTRKDNHLRFVLAAILAVLSIDSGSNSLHAQQPGQPEPMLVDLGLRLIDITEINSREETFTLEAVLYVDWVDPIQGANPGQWGEATADDRLKEMEWWPAPEFENGRGIRDRSGMLLSISEEGVIEYEERFSMTMASEMELRQFPFDTQILPINLLIGGGSEEFVRLEVSEYSPGLIRLPEWNITDESFSHQIEKGIRPYGVEDSPLFSRAVFAIEIQRRWGFYFWRIILPLLIITTVSWSVLWMKNEALGSRLTVSFTALLTVVAFNFIVSDTLPRIAYLTFLDSLITLTYVWLALTIIQSVIICRRVGATSAENTEKSASISRWIIPLTYYLACLVVVYLFWT